MIVGFGFGMNFHDGGEMHPFLSTLGSGGRTLDFHEFREKEQEIPKSLSCELQAPKKDPEVSRPAFSGLQVPNRYSDEWQRASLTFEILNSRFAYGFGVYELNGVEYHFAKSDTTEMLTLPARKWTISSYTGFDSFTTFTAHNDTERLAMRSFRFEETPLLWHFGRELIGGKWYNHAWTDTFLDMLIPEGQVMNIEAPEWYTKERKERARAAASAYVPAPSRETEEEKSNEILRESLWAATHAANAAKFRLEYEAKRAAEAACAYYRKTADFAVDFVLPGGIENCRKYSNNEITRLQFLDNIATDMRNDVICGMIGSLIGAGTGGAAGALASGGAIAIPGAVIGAKEGAAIGLAISRTIKAGIRSSSRSSSSSSSGSSSSSYSRSGPISRVARAYKAGNCWDRLTSVDSPAMQRKIGKINKPAFGGGEMRTDGEYVFRFDNGHKTGKVHMERYKKVKSNVWQGYGEIDPETGSLIEGSVARTSGRIVRW